MQLRSLERRRRLQIGGIGLAAVALLVGLASILGERGPGATVAASNGGAPETQSGNAPSEPLSELGVQPAPAAEDKVNQAAPPRRVQDSNPNALPPQVRPGERVQDLQPAAEPQAR